MYKIKRDVCIYCSLIPFSSLANSHTLSVMTGYYNLDQVDIHGFLEAGCITEGSSCYTQWNQQSIALLWLISHIALDLIKLEVINFL